MTRRWLLVAALLLVGAPAVAQSPNAVIEEAIAELAAALDGEGCKEALAADRDALYRVIDDILLPRFDRVYAANLVLGQHGRTASDEQKRRFIDGFYNSLLRKYADGVLEFEQDRIEVLTFRGDAGKSRVQVRTNVTLNDGTRVPVHYGLVKRGNQWKLFDVVIEGVSYIRNYRAELDAEIRASSLDAVIERLEREATGADGE